MTKTMIDLGIKYLENYDLKNWGEMSFAHSDDACFDMRAAINTASVIIKPWETVIIPTGVEIYIPKNYELRLAIRSGLAFKHNITMVNGIGIIDHGFRNEIKAKLINLSNTPYTIEKGDRIVQARLSRLVDTKLTQIKELEEHPERKDGFGSSGKK